MKHKTEKQQTYRVKNKHQLKSEINIENKKLSFQLFFFFKNFGSLVLILALFQSMCWVSILLIICIQAFYFTFTFCHIWRTSISFGVGSQQLKQAGALYLLAMPVPWFLLTFLAVQASFALSIFLLLFRYCGHVLNVLKQVGFFNTWKEDVKIKVLIFTKPSF